MKYAAIAVVIILVIVAAVLGFQMMNGANSTEMVNETPGNEMMEASTYQDGTYTQVGEYVSPGGPETISVTVTLSNGIISEVEVEPQAERPATKEKQADFAANYKPMVIGKSIDEVNLTKVSGSSLTPKGFQNALEKIKAEAKS